MIFSPEALRDLQEIEDYVSDESIEAARRTVDVLLERIRTLQRVPEAGRVRNEIASDIRSWPIQEYVVFYRVRRTVVEIVRILHGSRDVATAFNP